MFMGGAGKDGARKGSFNWKGEEKKSPSKIRGKNP